MTLLTKVKVVEMRTTVNKEGETQAETREKMTDTREELEKVTLERNKQHFVQACSDQTPFTVGPFAKDGPWKQLQLTKQRQQ